MTKMTAQFESLSFQVIEKIGIARRWKRYFVATGTTLRGDGTALRGDGNGTSGRRKRHFGATEMTFWYKEYCKKVIC